MQYPTKQFLAALTLGRGIRYALLGYLGAHYGRSILKFFGQYYWPVLITLIAFSAAAALFGLFEYKRRQKGEGPKRSTATPRVRRRTA
jgi:membrane protein DedA with SNARE-associated domain